MNRRQMLATTGAALVWPAVSTAAVSPQAARALVDGLVAEVNTVIAAGLSEAAMIDRFAGIFDRYSDVPTIARYCLGPDARSAEPAQMRAYTDAFRGYIATKYGRRFREFVGGEIVVVGATPVKSWVEVETTVRLRGRGPLRMDWHVSDRSGRDAFFNFIIEGVNMLLTERAEIGAMLDRRRRNIDALIVDMKAI
jgi:phospholipid transport system substrate-binding protein